MRILHIGKYFPPFQGGIENFMYDLMRACAGHGITQAAVVHHHARNEAFSKETCHVPGGEAFTLYRVPTYGQLVYAPISPAFRARLIQVVEEFNPDIIHLHMPNSSGFWLLGMRCLRSRVLIIHWHADVLGPGASPLLRLAYRAYRPLEQILLRRADVVITTSPDYLATSEPLRRWREKCVVIPLGLDPARVSIDRDCGYSPPWSQAGALKVLNVGRLAYYKGLGFLVEAVARTSGVELVLAGAGEERKSIESLVRARSLTTRVHLAGRLSDSERNRLMLACDVFCLPSINRNEAFGLVLLEAMALGRAAIVSRVPGSGMGWVVEDNRTGWHAVPGDIDSLANALSRARDNREMLDTMGKSARVRFMEHFDIRSVASRVTRIYQESA